MYKSIIIFSGIVLVVAGIFIFIINSQTPNQTPESKKTNDILFITLISVGVMTLIGTIFFDKKQKFFPSGLPVTTFTKRLKPELLTTRI